MEEGLPHFNLKKGPFFANFFLHLYPEFTLPFSKIQALKKFPLSIAQKDAILKTNPLDLQMMGLLRQKRYHILLFQKGMKKEATHTDGVYSSGWVKASLSRSKIPLDLFFCAGAPRSISRNFSSNSRYSPLT